MTMMKSLLAAAAGLAVLSKSTSALDAQVVSHHCESHAIRATLGEICNDDSICTFGKKASLSAKLDYYGVIDNEGMGENDEFYLDADLAVSLAGVSQEEKLIDGYPVLLCDDDYIADEDNEYGECPSDGSYYVFANYTLPKPSEIFTNDLSEWLTTGWSGMITLTMYQDKYKSNLIGRCYMGIQTHATENSFWARFGTRVDARPTLIILLVVICLGCLLSACLCPTRGKTVDDGAQGFYQMHEEQAKRPRLRAQMV